MLVITRWYNILQTRFHLFRCIWSATGRQATLRARHLVPHQRTRGAAAVAVLTPQFNRGFQRIQHTEIQWIGLRENLQETMVFTIKYKGFL